VIWFGTPPSMFDSSWPASRAKAPPSFELANEARAVFEQVLATQRQAKQAR